MPTAAILDVDGTLVDTNYHHAIAWYRAFRRHDVTPEIWRIHRHIGMGGDQLVGAVAGEDVEGRLGDEIREAEGELYMEMIDEVRPFPGARELVADWTTSADVESTKPQPDLVHAALEKVGADSGLLIGDTAWDCEAAARAGIPAVGVLTGGFGASELRDAGAVEVFRGVDEVREALASLPVLGAAPAGG